MERKLCFSILLAIVPSLVNAFGLGNIDVSSSLNDPLDAKIQLISPTNEELNSLKVRLAKGEAFARAKMERPLILGELRFKLHLSENDSPSYIKVYTQNPIYEPFLNFLVEVNWANGRLFREYTVLLNPPSYTPKKALYNSPNINSPNINNPNINNEIVSDGFADNMPQENNYVVQPENRYGYAGNINDLYDPSSQQNYTLNDYGPTSKSDTLWSIAKEMRPDASISVNQMMLALFHANPDAFFESNINALKRGQILRMPTESELHSISKLQALEETKSQYALWREKGYSSGVVADSPGVSPVYKEVVDNSGKTETTSKAPELKLVSADKSGDNLGKDSGSESSLSKELVLEKERIQSLNQENIELKDRLQEAESILNDLKRLIQLKDDQLSALQKQVADRGSEAEENIEDEKKITTEQSVHKKKLTNPSENNASGQLATEIAENAGSAEESIEEESIEDGSSAEGLTKEESIEEELSEDGSSAEGLTKEESIEEELSEDDSSAEELLEKKQVPATSNGILDKINQYISPIKDLFGGNPIYAIIGIIVLVILIMSVALMKFRNRARVVHIEGEATDASFSKKSSGNISNDPASLTSETGDVFEGADGPGLADSAINSDIILNEPDEKNIEAEFSGDNEDENFLQEINTYIAFEQFDKAEELIRNEIKNDKNNYSLYVKLLEIFYSSGDKKSYEKEAKIFNGLVGGIGDDWDTVVAMWNEMSPNKELFSEENIGDATADSSEDGFEDGVEEDFVDVTSESEEDSLDLDVSGDDDILDITPTPSNGNEDKQLDDFDIDLETQDDSLSASNNDVGEEELLDITSVADLETNEDDGSSLEFNADDIGEEELLDITSAADLETNEADGSSLEFNADDIGEEELLDITSAADLETNEADGSSLELNTDDVGEEEFIDITSAADLETNEADGSSLELDMDVNEEPSLDIASETNSKSDVNDFSENNDLQKSAVEIEKNTKTENIDDTQELSVGVAESLLDASDEDLSLDVDLDGTVELPQTTLDDSYLGDGVKDSDIFTSDSSQPHIKSMLLGVKDSDVFTSDSTNSDDEDVIGTKLDLAKAYVELGDVDNANTILNEVVKEGNEEQRKQAKELLNQV